ncbi:MULTISPECIES: nucleotidyltransferase family protein [unclassified Roseovarius]|uniref:nucleotidyltransferase family protein n=1 Tax=unclassified Roseovarius TaxID=2614913 RepID=UPI00273F72C3|nr:nucleotidyltransferase family protein [Roseovarius sp. MMSF_3350]
MRDAPDAVMLFAAGFGTRMGALTASRPKPLIEVAGKPLLDHALDLVAAYGPARAVVNTHYLSDQVATHLAGRDIAVSDEQPDILETGGGLRKALPLLGEGPVFTMNTDAVWSGPNPLAQLAAAWDPVRMDALLLCIPPQNAIGHTGTGDFIIDASGRATRGRGAIYSGLQILKTDGLSAIPEPAFSLNILWNRMLDTGRLHAVTYPGQWCDVGTPEGIPLAEEMLRNAHV